MGGDVPRLSWPCGIAFDTKRKRLIVATLGGVGYLYAFSPKTKKWSLLADLANLDLAGLVYDEKRDCLYGLHLGAKGATFTQYNANGAAVREIPLWGDPLPRDLGAAPLGPPVGLAAIDGNVFMVADAGVYLVDPTSGKVRKTSHLLRRPHRNVHPVHLLSAQPVVALVAGVVRCTGGGRPGTGPPPATRPPSATRPV
jgi:hypothetical protein